MVRIIVCRAASLQGQGLPTSLPFPLPISLLDGHDFSRAPWSPRDTDGLERRAVLGVETESCDCCFRNLDSLGDVGGGELGGSESGLNEAIALAPPST